MTNIQTIDKQSMEALQVLADTNVKIGEAKGILESLKQTESTYLQEREEKATKHIEKAFKESSQLLENIQHNYAEVHHLLTTASSVVVYLAEAQEKFSKVMSDFNKKADLWEEQAKKHEEAIADTKRKVAIDQKRIEIDQKAIAKAWESIKDAQKKIESDRGLLERNIKRLKEGKI